MGSTFGEQLKICIFGESHGSGIGVVIDGFPAGITFDEDFILKEMSRRRPSASPGSTPRREADLPKVLSGVYQGKTTGTPICALIENTDTRSGDYTEFSRTPRPGHADFTGSVRYKGFVDPRGGGHFSGRLTAPLVFAGALAKLALAKHNITIGAHISSIGTVEDTSFNSIDITNEFLKDITSQEYPVIDKSALASMLSLTEKIRSDGDSVGGTVECAVLGLPAGIGSPIFGAVESRLSAALFAIPGVHGVEFGSGFAGAKMRGSENNDPFITDNGIVRTSTNNHGGILGGITSGMPIIFSCAFKPTASIFSAQDTVNLETMQPTKLSIKGRHDPCIVYRAVPVVEAAAAIVSLDLLLEAYGYENIG